MPKKPTERKKTAISVSPKKVQLADLIGFGLRRAHFGAENHFIRLMGEPGLTPLQVGVLISLAQSGPITIAGLSEQIFVDRNTVGEMIGRMAKKGLVKKRIRKENRRAVEIVVASKGSEALRSALPAVVRSQKEVLMSLPVRDRRAFMKCLAIIASRFP